jgi:trans-aconitate 2-methyltransferase
VDLVARIQADPRTVVDLGCGPGNLTALLAERWPQAQLRGVDSSAEMIASARRDLPGLDFEVADLREWLARGERADVVISNATLQWLPDHVELLPSLAEAAGEWLAFQVPGNFGEPSHTIRTELAAEPAYAEHMRGVAVPSSREPVEYLEILTGLGWTVDAWETTYLHVLEGEDAVFTWVSGTGARPTLQALPEGLRADFEAEFKRRLREAYPVRDGRVVLPFRRIFVVAHR